MRIANINRKLASSEECMEILNERASSLQVVTISRISGYLNPDVLRQSLNLVQQRHPRLNCRIVSNGDNFWFETEDTEKIPLRVVNSSTVNQWQAVAIEELNQKINSQKCLARVVLVSFLEAPNINYIITTIHHAITDAISSIYLHQNILEYCHKILAGKNIEAITTLPNLPSTEDLLPNSMMGLRGKINILMLILRIQYLKIYRDPKTFKFQKSLPLEMRQCGLIHKQLNETLTKKLIATCSQRKVTIQGALSAAMLLSAFRRINTSATEKINLNCLATIDLRRRLIPVISPEDLSLRISMMVANYQIDKNTSFWELAAETKKEINLFLERNYVFSIMKLFGKLMQSFLDNLNQSSITVGVTNVGKVNIARNYGNLQLEEISFALGAIFAGGIPIAAVTTFPEKMSINFIFSEPSISQEFMAGFVDDVLVLITEACE
jgi:Condensation domain